MSMSIGGLASGLDIDSIITQLMSLERRPIMLMQKRQQELEAQKGAWRDVNTRLKNLDGKFSALKLQSTYLAKLATSSDEKLLTATAGSNAAEGVYSINVTKLATGVSQYSEQQADATSALQVSGDIVIRNHDASKTWTVSVGIDDSLNAIASKINKAEGIEVTATVVDNRLVLNSKSTGSKSNFSVDMSGSASISSKLGGTDGLLDTVVGGGLDAELTINGLAVTSQSNTLKDVIQGVTVNLEATGTSKLTVKADTEKVTKEIEAFVEQYNSTLEFVNEKLAKGGTLQGDSSLMRLQSSLRQMVTSSASYTAGQYQTLADIGISTAKFVQGSADYSGKLQIDSAKLKEALLANPTAVKDILFKETNVASSAQGAMATGASFNATQFPVESVLDGITDSTNWANGQGWNSEAVVSTASPGVLTVSFSSVKTLERLKLYTLDSTAFPADQYGVKDFEVFYYDQNGVAQSLATVAGNTAGSITQYLDSIKTDKLEFRFTAANDGQYARVVEVEAYENTGVLHNLENYIDQFIRSGDGILSEKDKSYDNQIKDIKDQIERMEDRLEMRQQTLVRQFTAMEKALSSMQSQSNWLAGQLSQLSSTSGSQK